MSVSNCENSNQELRKVLPEERVSTDPAVLERYAYDGLKVAFRADAVITVEKDDEVGKVLRLANRERIPVTVRGAGSTLTGAAAPRLGGWVIDLTRLNRCTIDSRNAMAHVGAGTIVADLQTAAEAVGFFYPPDPSSRKFCTVGGTIACNAGGMRCVKYGVTRDYVLALEGFLPTGEAVSWGKAVRKFATAYNMRDLWIGSEGTLGVVTGATLRLIPKPPSTWGMVVAFPGERDALSAIVGMLRDGNIPAICEFIDVASVRGAEKASGQPFFAGRPGRSLALVQLDGSEDQVHSEAMVWRAWAQRLGEAFEEMGTPETQEVLWEIRRGCSSAMFELGDRKLNEDVVVPLDRQAELMDLVEDLRKRHAVSIAVFGHAGDGNLHVNIMYHEADAGERERSRNALQELMEGVIALGGAISGEHGIGLAKSPFLDLQFRKAELQAMKNIKSALDPNHILNPGKIFEPFEVWNEPKVEVRLPWDHR